ncbi:MAG: DUF6602 domain-containing protein [Rhodospirillales bacterium]
MKVAAVLRGEAEVASIFPNGVDIGTARENIYREFLRQHVPSKCNVFSGGYLFAEDGAESKQLDLLVTTDTIPRFNFYNRNNDGKSFSPVEGALAVASIKSKLDKNELDDALDGIASIPASSSLDGRLPVGVKIHNYDDWPYKIIYASDGISGQHLLKHIEAFYGMNQSIPFGRRPNIIHVSGKYIVLKAPRSGSRLYNHNTSSVINVPCGTFILVERNPDFQGIVHTLHNLQIRAQASVHIMYLYDRTINNLLGIPISGWTSTIQSDQIGGESGKEVGDGEAAGTGDHRPGLP